MLELVDLRRRFGTIEALAGVSLTIEPGEILGLLGPNGAGKTTTMRAVMGILGVDSGSLRWNGKPIRAEDRRQFGYMPEERGMYPKMRLGDQLRYLARLHGLTAASARRRRDVVGRSARPRRPARHADRRVVAREPATGTARGGARFRS